MPKKNSIEDPHQAKKSLGQYFTVASELQDFVFNHVQHRSAELLEPSFGAGHLLKKFIEFNADYPMTCYEIDSSIKPIIKFNGSQTAIYGDFMDSALAPAQTKKFKTIIGNPPFVAVKKEKNLYIQFIEKCYELLAADGELIFIVPSDFIKLTSAAPIIEKMCATGSFTHFLFPHNEHLFDGASIDVVCFRYAYGILSEGKCIVNGSESEYNVKEGIITFSAPGGLKGPQINELFGVYVGLVSGRDEIYRSPIGNMDLLMDKDKVEKFIFMDAWPFTESDIKKHLEAHKEELMARRIRKFNEENWYEWGAPRNIATMKAHKGRPCIYVRTLTRQKEVAFIGTVQFFGGGLLCLIPIDGAEVPLEKIVGFLNSSDFQKDYLYAGRFKIGHKQISNVILREPLAPPPREPLAPPPQEP